MAVRRARGVFAGAGSDGLNEPSICKEIMRLIGKESAATTIAYLGTATYDLDAPRKRQTQFFSDIGCTVVSCPVAQTRDKAHVDGVHRAIQAADCIIVSGGNTLFAMDCWKHLGIDAALREAANRGCVLAGGSAGAICWFDAGHSDSAEPSTFREAMLAAAGSPAAAANKDESSSAPERPEDALQWEYIRVGCLGILPGFVCPHYDKVASNGILRAHDFKSMLKRHSGECGIGIDHWAALVVDGDTYAVVGAEGKGGSQLPDGGFSPDQSGRPGVWKMEWSGDTYAVSPVPPQGAINDIVREGVCVADPGEEKCRLRNPAV
jgi:dipeptidase E